MPSEFEDFLSEMTSDAESAESAKVETPEATAVEAVETSNVEVSVETPASTTVENEQASPDAGGVTPPAAAPVAEDELTLLRKQNEALLAQINNLSLAPTQAVPQTSAEPAAEMPELFGEWTYDAIAEDEASFKKFMLEFATKLKTSTEEAILRKIPSTVSRLTNEQLEARKSVENFYEVHPQLAQTKPFIAQIVTTVSSEHADWSLEQVLEESANRAYTALALKPTVAAGTPTKPKPAFAGPASTGRTSAPQVAKSQLEKELEEMMSLEQ